MKPALSSLGLPAVLVAGLVVLAACARSPQTPVQAATVAACRERADQIYDRQNRADLSRRDERDTPQSASYLSGITTRGLGARFERGQRIAECTNGLASGTGSPSPTMSPASDGTSGTSNP